MSSLPLKSDPPSKVQEPSMEEILASIRKIISDEAVTPPAPKMAAVKPAPAPPEPVSEPQGQDDIDALLAGFDDAEARQAVAESSAPPDVLELTEDMAAPSDADFSENDIDFVEPAPPKP